MHEPAGLSPVASSLFSLFDSVSLAVRCRFSRTFSHQRVGFRCHSAKPNPVSRSLSTLSRLPFALLPTGQLPSRKTPLHTATLAQQETFLLPFLNFVPPSLFFLLCHCSCPSCPTIGSVMTSSLLSPLPFEGRSLSKESKLHWRS